jgi:hypothetical protein
MKKLVLLLGILIMQSCKGQTEKIDKNKFISSQKREITKKEKNNSNNYVEFKSIDCDAIESENEFYNLSCNNNFTISNTIIKNEKNKQIEFITINFKDISKAIIRNINKAELITNTPNIYYNKLNKSYLYLFPLVSEYNFGWILYYYKDKRLYFLGRRITFWNPKYEESKISYKDFTKIYENENSLIVEMSSENIIGNDNEYQKYPNYLDGKMTREGQKYLFEFSLNNLINYKKYDDNSYEGDYNIMINKNIIQPIE